MAAKASPAKPSPVAASPKAATRGPSRAATRTVPKARAEVPAKAADAAPAAAAAPAQAAQAAAPAQAAQAAGARPAAARSASASAASTPGVDRIAKAYDELPYQSKPFPQATPEQMAAMARLFKLTPPDIATARVLELGCSAGGHIIPLAVRYPKLQAVGIDISNVEIEQGKIQLVKLGIENCRLMCLDIAQSADRIEGRFDYIICHGVFSWVPEHVRQAILQVIQDKLSPNGVAYISYNVYPGWKMREVIRDMMMFHAGGLQEPAQQLAQAKAILEYTKNITGEASTFGKMLRDEAALMSKVSDDYLMHEHLSHENHPMYFRDFIQQAADHQLAYLGEALLGDMAPQRLGPDVFNTLSTLSAGNILATEQYMDFFTNRVFRQTLLVHQAQAPQVDRGIKPALIEGFSFTTALKPDPKFDAAQSPGVLSQYVDAAGRVLTVRGLVPHEALRRLTDARPYPLDMAAMLAACRENPQLAAVPEESLRGSLGTELVNLLLQNMVRLHLAPLQPPAQRERPRAFALARVQAEAGQPWVTNPLHQSVALSQGHRAALALMDGQRDLDALTTALVAHFRDGRLNAMRGQERITDEAQLQDLARAFAQQSIGELAALALLV
jgi:methyltransferase-like protein/2-polyprenyl-3-methyl-5-hydroxy-6-metoxy-1,4-benzoquinol methylase